MSKNKSMLDKNGRIKMPKTQAIYLKKDKIKSQKNGVKSSVLIIKYKNK